MKKKIIQIDEDTLEIREILIDEEETSEDRCVSFTDYDEINKLLQGAMNCEPEEFYQKYRDYKTAEANFNKLYEPFKANIIELHEKHPEIPKGVVIGGMKLTYVSPSERKTIDSKKLKEEEPEIAKKFTKTTNVKASVRIEEV